MEFKENILEAIGNTPIVKVNKVNKGVPGELLVKCEFMNPGGSIKDRIGRHIIEHAEANGEITPGGTVVEGTSGNTGVGLAIASAVKGYQAIFVLPDKMSEEKRQNLRAFGAKVVIAPTAVPADSPESYYSVAERLVRETPNSFYSNQYHNLANRETHYKTTGPEIWEQTQGDFDTIVIGMGTCGTISGIGRYLKEKKPSIKVVGVDPKGSILKDLFETGKIVEAKGYLIEGIGEDIIPKNLDMEVIDHMVRVHDKESYLMTRRLLKEEGIYAGVSSGSAIVGAIRYMESLEKPERVLVILPDSGNRYLSKAYNDEWMRENGFLDAPTEANIGHLIKQLDIKPSIISIQKDVIVADAVETMRTKGVSQMPVKDGTQIIGVIKEMDLLRTLVSGTINPTDTVERLADPDYKLLFPEDPIKRLNEVFTGRKMALVGEGNDVKYILTHIDLISYLSKQPKK